MGRREELAAIGCHDDVLLLADHPIARHKTADLEGVDLVHFELPVWTLAVPLPARPEHRAAIVAGTSHLVAERVLPLFQARFREDSPGDVVDFPAHDARSNKCGGILNATVNDREVALHIVWRLGFARLQEVKGPLQVRAVLILSDTEVDTEKLARACLDIRRSDVAAWRVRAGRNAWAVVPVP